jgi:dephospho-CoA kinase
LSRWMGKYLIGITGNIASGKTSVRKLLEHLGAYSFEIDMITRRALSQEGPLYSRVTKAFGEWIFDERDSILLERLGSLFFAEPALKDRFDAMVDPVIDYAIDVLVRNSKRNVIAIESRKLLDMDLAVGCDSIWVVSSRQDLRIQRLITNREFTESEARQRILVESPQAYLERTANVVIENSGSMMDLWERVKERWAQLPKPKEPVLTSRAPVEMHGLTIRLAMPHHAAEISRFITQVTLGKLHKTSADVMRDFTEKSFVLVEAETGIVGVAGWRLDSLVCCVDEFHFARELESDRAIPILMRSIEDLAHEMLSEVIILILPAYLARMAGTWMGLGYQGVSAQSLPMGEWQEVALHWMRRGYLVRYKRLRETPVLKMPGGPPARS